MGVEVAVHELTKSFGRQTIWKDVTLTLPPGEVSVLLGPSGTGKSVFLKSLIGLLKPDKGSIIIRDVDIARCSEGKLYETRKLFGVLFQDGALFGSMNLFDNIAFPLREHTKKSEREIKQIVTEKPDVVGLAGSEKKVPEVLERYSPTRLLICRIFPSAGARTVILSSRTFCWLRVAIIVCRFACCSESAASALCNCASACFNWAADCCHRARSASRVFALVMFAWSEITPP